MSDTAAPKRVLIISYYWPPSGGVGVHRCLKFAKYLRDFGWEPVVYTASGAQYPYFDPTNERHIPPGITVLKRPIWEPYNLFKVASGRKPSAAMNNPVHVRDKRSRVDNLAIWVRGNFFIPDARALWIRPSVRWLGKWLEENHVDAILSDGPPHTNTRIACLLAKRHGIPWLADYQDPWTQVDYYKLLKLTRLAHARHRRMEAEAFRVAAQTTIASPTWARDLESIGARGVEVVYWGYDEQEFADAPCAPDTTFSLTHAGMLGFDRLPQTLFRVLGDLCARDPAFAADLRVNLPGMVDYSIVDELRRNGLEGNAWLPGTITRVEAIERTFNAQMLLLPLNKADNAQGRIPGKLFECMRARRPILCLGPEGSDVSRIIAQTNTGRSFGYDDYDGLRQYIEERYRLFKEGHNMLDVKDIEQYSVREQTRKVARMLDTIARSQP